MLTLRRPTGDQIGAFLAAQAVGPFSYAAVGGTRAGACPPRFNVDHNRIQLGSGEAVFVRAVAALQRWAMFDLEWVTLCWPSASRLAPAAQPRAAASLCPRLAPGDAAGVDGIETRRISASRRRMSIGFET